MTKHMYIPDTQVKPGVPLDHLDWAGHYMVDKKPDVVVMAGDFADMESLCSYDIGKKSFEGRRYKADIEVAHEAMRRLLTPLWTFNSKAVKNHEKRYSPTLVMLGGNHEQRIVTAVEQDAKLEGMLSLEDLGYEGYGWEVIPFLQPVVIDGIAYSHYFPSGVLGRATTSARALLTKMHMSCVAGHLQGRDIAYGKRADGQEITAIIAGSYYQHDEAYLSPFTNTHWRGLYMFHDVRNGSFDEMAVSLKYLKEKYSERTLLGESVQKGAE